MDRELMRGYGIDCDRGLKNCMGSEAFYKRILGMFLNDGCFTAAQAAFAAGDTKELFRRMHELKGIAGNAGLGVLYDCAVPLVELLRKDGGTPEETGRLFAAAEAAYAKAREGASRAIAEP